ncbi:MAG: HlyD family secretion protein [Alphaproteobacteria bacterium]|nr:HlyD family secretion protein [Alphaproteobacteria bacterium]
MLAPKHSEPGSEVKPGERRPADPLIDVMAGPTTRRRSSAVRRTLRIGVIALIAGAGAGGLALWMHDRFTHVYINDARIAADVVAVSSRVPGRIVEVNVSTGDLVKSDQVLAVLDSRQAELRLGELEAQLKSLGAERDRLEAQMDVADRQTSSAITAARSRRTAAEANLAALASDLNLARSSFERTDSLLAGKIISQQRWDADRAALEKARQAHEKARAEIDVAAAALLQAEADRRQILVFRRQVEAIAPREDDLKAQINRQRLEIEDHRIKSPIDGVIDGIFIKLSENVAVGQRLLLAHAPGEVWVDANVKETDIRHLKVGKTVTVSVDAYPDQTFEGRILRVGDVATSQFSLLPNPNPSGNFTKVTQRLPVKIGVLQQEGKLRPGMMVEVQIGIGD